MSIKEISYVGLAIILLAFGCIGGYFAPRSSLAINVPTQNCMGGATTATPFSLASTTALKVVTKATGKNVYICAINIVSATAQNVALLAGTFSSADCDTSTAGLAGGTTAATGWNFAANDGLTAGNGTGLIAQTATTGLDVCLKSSSTGQISGSITWSQF